MPQRKRYAVIPSQPSASPMLLKLWQDHKAKKMPLPNVSKLVGLKGVRKLPDGIYVNEAIADYRVSGALQTVGAMIKSAPAVKREYLERMSLIKQLHDLGYDVIVPMYNNPELAHKREQIPLGNGIRKFYARAPIERGPDGQKILNPSAFWARDLWVKKEGKRVTYFQKGGKEEFGEGGRLVELPNKAFVASANLRGNKHVEELQRKGYKFYFTVDGYAYESRMSKVLGKDIYMSIDHVDMFLGTIGKVLLVDGGFFKQNPITIKQIASERGMEIVFVPDAERKKNPANFLPLEENTILMDRSAVKTIELLRSKGIKVIPTYRSMTANRAARGGLRCIINEM